MQVGANRSTLQCPSASYGLSISKKTRAALSGNQQRVIANQMIRRIEETLWCFPPANAAATATHAGTCMRGLCLEPFTVAARFTDRRSCTALRTENGTRLRCSFGHATHQPPSSVRDRCRADRESFPCAGTEARKSGTENLMPTGPTRGGVAACRDFAILATTAERREAFYGKASSIGCARASMLVKPSRARDVKNKGGVYRTGQTVRRSTPRRAKIALVHTLARAT
jgi:hypothetical protein